LCNTTSKLYENDRNGKLKPIVRNYKTFQRCGMLTNIGDVLGPSTKLSDHSAVKLRRNG
jgi:hypothetical protein